MKQIADKITFIRSRINSFRFAFNGLYHFFKQEPNAWLHVAATILVVIAAYYYKVAANEWITLVIVTGFVWVAEAFNTVIERTMDIISPQKDPRVRFIKDLAAGAVVLAAITALITGCIIFIPKIF